MSEKEVTNEKEIYPILEVCSKFGIMQRECDTFENCEVCPFKERVLRGLKNI